MTPKTLNTIAAVATIFAGIFALAAALIPITAIIAAPVSLGFALISGCSWLKAARSESDKNAPQSIHTVVNTTKEPGNIKGETIQHSVDSPQYHNHHLRDMQKHHNDLSR